MRLRVIGAGLPRTGTTSLKAALERLLGEPCYHMFDLRDHDDHGPLWMRALEGDMTALDQVLAGCRATTDWPASLFWRELIERHPEALVVLSHRGSAETWWGSADRTVWAAMRRPDNEQQFKIFHAMMRAKAGLGDDWDDQTAAMAHYDALSAEVIETVPPERLVVWQPGDGWEPICTALGVAVPDEAFAHLNPTEDFRRNVGLDDAETTT